MISEEAVRKLWEEERLSMIEEYEPTPRVNWLNNMFRKILGEPEVEYDDEDSYMLIKGG
jgi:hypothetical protein